MYCENVTANPDIGRARTQAGVFSQNGKRLVTMSRITLRGITAYQSVNTALLVKSSLCEGSPATGEAYGRSDILGYLRIFREKNFKPDPRNLFYFPASRFKLLLR